MYLPRAEICQILLVTERDPDTVVSSSNYYLLGTNSELIPNIIKELAYLIDLSGVDYSHVESVLGQKILSYSHPSISKAI